MEKSEIYSLLERGLLKKWQTDIEKWECDTWDLAREQELLTELEQELNEHEKKLLKCYSLAIESRLDSIYYSLGIKLLNFGIKIGLELEKSFAEFED